MNNFCIVLCHSSQRHDTSTPSLMMAGMIWDGACNFVQAMPRYSHKIERLDKLRSLPRKVEGRNAQFCVCASLIYTGAISGYRGRVLVCRAAPWPVIENIYVVLQRCWYGRKKENKKKWTKSWFVRSKRSLQQFVRNWLLSGTQRVFKITSGCQNNFTLPILFSTKHGMFEEW